MHIISNIKTRVRLLRMSLATSSIVMTLAAAAQTSPPPYQHCELAEPVPNAVHRIETNYRYSPAASVRSLKGMSPYRCDAAWTQTKEGFLAAFDFCSWNAYDCSVDEYDTCTTTSGSWLNYEFLASSQFADSFKTESVWPTNPLIHVQSGAQHEEEWTRHKWFFADPEGLYNYLGVSTRLVDSGLQYPQCYGMAYAVGFFNGVWNTKEDAENGLEALQDPTLIGTTHNTAPVVYQLFYNQTGCSSSTVACLDDLAEVFIQRSDEIDGVLKRRWEYFWGYLHGRSDKPDSWTATLRSRVQFGASSVGSLLDGFAAATLAKMTSLMAQAVASPPTATDTVSQIDGLFALGQEGFRAVLIAHSQGNLFVNAAYQGYLSRARAAGVTQGEDTNYVAAKVVHVAPASAVVNGPVILAAVDVVIEAIRHVDGTAVPANTLDAASMPRSTVDVSGHRLIETYLDPNRPARAAIKQAMSDAMDAL